MPAVDATFREHHGKVILMEFLKLDGPFCRTCGLAVFRDKTARTLIAGWWGLISFFITPVTILANLVARYRIGRLAAPQPLPGHVGELGSIPMDPGKPLYRRPAILGLAVPVFAVAIMAMAVIVTDNNDANGVGTCLDQAKIGSAHVVSCESRHNYIVVAVVSRESQCPAHTAAVLTRGRFIWCLVPD